jgi:lipoate-protein ligase A
LLYAPQGGGEQIKICGSAQRRHSGAVLQHGGVLLAASRSAPELLGLREAAGVTEIPAGEFRELWKEVLARELNLTLSTPQELSVRDRVTAAEAVADKFGTRNWTYRR